MNNAELIKALREAKKHFWTQPQIELYPMMESAADAFEAAEKRIDGLQKLVDINTERCEALRKQLRESHECYEKRVAELEAQLPKEGEWTTKRTWDHDGEIYCSVCDHDAPTEGDYRQVKTNYCPNCGARMRGEHDEQ